MNYWLAIIILIELKEYKCCGPAGTSVHKCTKWNQVTFAGSLAENMTIYSTTEFKMSSLFKSRKMEEQKLALLQYYVSFGVDLMQLKVYEIINYELQKNSSEPLYFLFAESSYKVSRYYFRTHNYEKGLTFVKNAITKIEQLPVDGFFCSHKLSMWLAYLRGSQIDIMKSIENNNETIDIINSRRRDDFNKAFMKYQLLLKERNFNRDSRMEFLIGKEYLKVVDAHIPLNEDYLKLKKNYAIETGIEWLQKYEDKFINPSNLIESSFILGNIYMKLDQKNYAKYYYLKAIKEPVKNAEDRALNYEIAKTIAKFFYGVINDLDEEVENNFNSFWEILQSTPDKFEPSIVNNFVRTVTKHNSNYVTKSSVDKITDDIIDKGINALEKIQYSQSLYEYYKWSAVLSSAKCYSTTKSRAHLDLKINLEGALSNKSELDDANDIHLTYLVGKYACEASLYPDGIDIFSSVGWNFKSDIKRNKKLLNNCIEEMEKLCNKKSPFFNEIDKNKLLAEAYWNKKQYEKAIDLLEKTIFTLPVINAEDRWYNFTAQELLGYYQEKVFTKMNIYPKYPSKTFKYIMN